MQVLCLKRQSPDAALLAEIAREALRLAGSPRDAPENFVAEIRDAGGLANALFDDSDLEVSALRYLEKLAASGAEVTPP